MQEFRRMAAAMDERARQLMKEGVLGPELIRRMIDHMPDLQRIWVGASDQQLAALCQNYPGVYEYASLMEEAAEAQRANPGQSRYKDLPELDEPLKRKLSDLLTDAAVLEQQYQALIGAGARQGDANIDELSRMHGKWLSNRDRFIESVKESNLPKSVSEFVVPTLGQMADRIAQLKVRAGGK